MRRTEKYLTNKFNTYIKKGDDIYIEQIYRVKFTMYKVCIYDRHTLYMDSMEFDFWMDGFIMANNAMESAKQKRSLMEDLVHKYESD